MNIGLEVKQLLSPSQSRRDPTTLLKPLLLFSHLSLAGWWPYGW